MIIELIFINFGRAAQLKNLVTVDTLLPLGAIMGGVILALKFLGRFVPALKKHFKKFLIYCLLASLIIGVFVAILYNLKQSEVLFRYFSIVSFMLLLGGLHVFFYRQQFDRMDDESYLKELVIAIIAGAFLMLPIILIVSYYSDFHFLYNYFIGILAFILPTSIYGLFNYSVSIPSKIYSKWYYPLDNRYEAPKHYELTNMMILNFMFYKNKNEQHLTSFKVKAPKDMNFGRLFYFFVNDYNLKNAKNKIEMLQDTDDPYGWYYTTKPKWYGGSKHINSEITVENNNLKDGDSVVCQRI